MVIIMPRHCKRRNLSTIFVVHRVPLAQPPTPDFGPRLSPPPAMEPGIVNTVSRAESSWVPLPGGRSLLGEGQLDAVDDLAQLIGLRQRIIRGPGTFERLQLGTGRGGQNDDPQ